MKYTTKQYALSLFEVLSDANPKDHDRIIDNFIAILKANQDLKHYEAIIEEVEKLFTGQEETSQIKVTTAQDKTFDEKLLKHLNEYTKKQVEVEHKIDSNILGGVIIQVDDNLIDASIKTQLDNLGKDLRN